MTRFNIGDIVVQKSGGPRMTICASGKNVMCQWLVNGKIEVGTFSVATLELAETSEDEDVYAEMRKSIATHFRTQGMKGKITV